MTGTREQQLPATSDAVDDRRLWNEVIALFYESAGSVASQQQFLTALSRLFDADSAAFVVWAAGPTPVMRAVGSGLDSVDLETEYAYRASFDNLFHTLRQAEDFSVVSGRFGQRSASTLAGRQWLAGVLDNDNQSRCAALIVAQAGATAPDQTARAKMQELLPFFQRGLRQNRLFERYRHTAQAGAYLMDRAMRGILLFSPRGAITYRNEEAERILDDDDGFILSGVALSFSDVDADEAFNDFLAAARNPQEPDNHAQLGLTLRVNRPSGKAPYQLVLYRMPTGLSEATLDQTLSLVACLIHDPEHAVDPSGDSIRQFFQLTPAETNLAIALMQGHRLADAAKSLGISINTARTQLKGIFHKLGVNSQPAMMQRLTRSLEFRQPDPPVDKDETAPAAFSRPDA